MISASIPLTLLITTAAASGGAGGGPKKPSPAENENTRITWWIGYTWAATFAALLVYRVWTTAIRYIRTLACLENDKQQYFTMPDPTFSWFKRHIVDAPLFRKRHNREFRLSAAVNVGTLPGRLQTLYLVGYVAMNITFCVYSIDWSGESTTLANEIRNRTGILSVMNMLPLFLMAGRNNPLISLFDISFDTYNLMHRQIGRIVVFEALAHTIAWMTSKVMKCGSQHSTLTRRSLTFSSWLGCHRQVYE